MKNFLSALKRFGRVALGVALAGIPAYFADEPRYLLLAPIINAVGKWLRAKFALKNIPF